MGTPVFLYQVQRLLNEDRAPGAWTLVNTFMADHPNSVEGKAMREQVRTALLAQLEADRARPDYVPPTII